MHAYDAVDIKHALNMLKRLLLLFFLAILSADPPKVAQTFEPRNLLVLDLFDFVFQALNIFWGQRLTFVRHDFGG